MFKIACPWSGLNKFLFLDYFIKLFETDHRESFESLKD